MPIQPLEIVQQGSAMRKRDRICGSFPLRPITAGPALLALVFWLGWLPVETQADADVAEEDKASASDERQTLDRPRPVVLNLDGQQLRGVLVAYGDAGFEMLDREQTRHHIEWKQLDAERVYVIHRELLSRRDGRAWLELGIRLRRMDDGEPFSDRALLQVERVDEALAERARAIREHGLEALETFDEASEGAAARSPDPQADPLLHDRGPTSVGEIEPEHWSPVSEQEQQRTIDRLDAFAQAGLDRIDVAMERYETRYFLLYTDMRPTEARRWVGLADRMYDRLAGLFNVEKDKNIWRGKALLLLFNHRDDYHRFEKKIHGEPGEDTIGRCWTFGSGEVHLTLYRQPDRYRFASVLVHEATHGFLHRYRSPVLVPSWLNEGLADTIAAELVPEDRSVQQRQHIALTKLRRQRDLGSFFDARHIEAWHYGIASSMTQYMLRHNRPGYVAMIDAIKDGLDWRASFEEKYGQTLETFVREWGESEHIVRLDP